MLPSFVGWPMEKTTGAGRGNRTPTVLSDLRILSPLRLPISPSRPASVTQGATRPNLEDWLLLGETLINGTVSSIISCALCV